MEILNVTTQVPYLGNSSTLPEREHWEMVLDKVSTISMAVITVIVMLGMGSAICLKEIISHVKRPIGAAIGMLGQFVVLPATGFGLSLLFGLRPYEALGVLMISCSPGGAFSNVFTFWVDGDLALSVMMTTVSSIVAFGGMPFNLWLYSNYWLTDGNDTIVIPFLNIVKSLTFVMGPVIIGMVIKHFHEKTANIITKVASMIGWLGFFAVATIWTILYRNVFMDASSLIYAAATLLPITGFSLAYGIAKIFCQPHRICRTIGIETGSQNMPVALSVILLSFSDPYIKAQMIMFPTLYAVMLIVEVFIGIFTFQLYKKMFGKGDVEDQPMTHMATIESGTNAEKAALKT